MKENSGIIIAICSSAEKHVPKHALLEAQLQEGHGLIGDAHAGEGHRQVSFLAQKSIESMKEKGAQVSFGSFGENIVTQGLDFQKISIGDKFLLGKDACVEITQIGKDCHSPCAIYESAGFCIMPQEGIFAKVIKSGRIRLQDFIKYIY